MAISSRLALWEQKIKEEDRSPPPTSPPPIFSVIPGGFIKQLVRETEKESKEAKLKEKIPLNSKEDPPGKVDDGSVIKDTTNLLEAGQGMANSKGQGSLVQGWLNGEGEGMAEIPERKRGAGSRIASPTSPSDPSQLPRTSFSPEGGKKDLEKVPEAGKKTHHPTPWSKQRLESLGKENVKTRAKDEGVAGRTGLRANKGANKEKTTGETGKKIGENKEKLGDTVGKKLRENEEKMAVETGKKMGENKEKITGKMGENKEKMGEIIGKKLRENEEKIMGETGKKVGENKEKVIGKIGENKEIVTGKMGQKIGENKQKIGEIIGKKLRENEEKTGETGGKVGENKEKLIGKMGENKEKITGKMGGKKEIITGKMGEKKEIITGKMGENKEKITGKMGENKEKITGKMGENKEKITGKMGENKEKITGKMGENKEKITGKMVENKEKITGKMGENKEKLTGKMGENKEKTREIIGEKLRENEEKTTGEKERKMGENKEKTAKKVIKSKEETRGELGENKEKVGEIIGGKREKITGETGEKAIEETEENEKKIKEIGEKREQKLSIETGESEENKVDLGEITDSSEKEDVWYETEKVWLVQKDGFTLATELKPDVGTPELPPGMVRVRVESDGSVFEVDEEQIQKTNPSRFDYAEDLASLVSLNESSAINTLVHRFRSQLVYTYSGPDLIAIEPWSSTTNNSKKAFKGKRDGMSPHIFSVAQKAYWTMLTQRQDQAVIPLGRSGSGKTTCCQNVLEYLVENAGSVDNRVTVEKIQAMFTILQAFGAVSDGRNGVSTRFSMAMALDFNAAGRITAAHLQTMLLERIRVAQQPDGEGNFNVFAQMLAGLDLDQRTLLHLHHVTDSNSFGIRPPSTAEERQSGKASFSGLQSAFRTMGISIQEEGALCRVLAAIVHLGAAGAAKVGRKQFQKWEAANEAAEALGCEFEELSSAVFKHHLRSIIQQATGNVTEEEPTNGPKLTGVECLEGMAAGLYEELFAAVVSLINRSFSSTLLSMASILVLDLPGFRNPRHHGKARAASFEEFCANYAQERLQALFYQRTFTSTMERYQEEGLDPSCDLPGSAPSSTVALVDQSPSQVSLASARKGAEPPKGLLWILEEEALLPGLSDSRAVQRLGSAFNTQEGPDFLLRKCEQEVQFEVGHLLGHDPVRYDATGWVSKAKWNLSAENAAQVLQQSRIEAIKELFQGRCKVPLVCRSVAGLEGTSQQALQRIGCVRKTFASSFAAVKKKSVCAQIKLQLDALCNLVKRSQIHFVHCLLPTTETETQPDPTTLWDIPSLRVQLSGGQILDALRFHRIGYADRMALTQFRRRFQILAQPLMRKYTSAYETTDEKKALEELLRALDLEKKSIALGRTQVFLKAGLLSRLEKQRDKTVSPNLSLFQAACKGFLSRQNYRKLKVQRLAIRCIQRNLLSFQRVKAWSWWALLGRLRPLLTTSRSADQLQAKEEELSALRKKLEDSKLHRQNLEFLETKVIDLTAELLDERLKAEAACRVLDAERSERLKGSREVKELQNKHNELQKKLEAAEKQLEETQQKLKLRELSVKSSGKGEEWQMRLDCAETEIGFLRKRIALLEERLETEQKAKKEIEEKLSGAQSACEAARRASQQFQRKCQRLSCDLEDTRLLVESQQNRNHELEKRQKKFDLQLAQALGESAFEKSLREKVMQENTNLQFQFGKMQKNLEEKESEKSVLVKRLERLTNQVAELCSPSNGLDPDKMASLRKQVWDLEESAAKREEELSLQAKNIEHLEQLHLRLELEIERKRHLHQKEMEDKEEEMDDLRGACQKKLRQLEMQCEQEAEEKQRLLAEKRDLEGLIATLCEQVGHRDFEAEKRLRRDLKRSRALLADAQLLLQESSSGSEAGSTEVKGEMEKLRRQWGESVARCAEAQEFSKALNVELEGLRLELEKVTRNKNLVDEQLYQLQHEKADLLKRIDEDQEDLNDLMEKHKALIAQSAKDISQIQDLQGQLQDLKKEKQNLQEKLQALESRLKGPWGDGLAERSIVSRQEALIREQENKAAFQSVQVKRLEMLVLRLRESLIRVGEEAERGKESERREKENAEYAWRRMEEMKAQMQELQDRENQAQHTRVQLEKQVDELSAVRQTLQADLETAIRRIADLQAALEEVRSSDEDESDTESVHTAKETLTSRMDTESVGSSSISVHSWRSTWSDLSKDPERRSVASICTGKIGANVQREGGESCKSPRSASSFALSEYVEELRRKRLKEEELGDPGPNLPIYQTTGASVLRRSRPVQGNDDSCEALVRNVQGEAAASLQAKPWKSSLEEIREVEKPKPALKFGSCESLVRDVQNVQNEAAASVQTKPWKSSLEEIRELDKPIYSCKSLVRDVQNVQNVQNEAATSVQAKPWKSSLEEIRELDKPIYSCKSLVRDVQNVQNVQNEAATSVQAKPGKSSLEEIREFQNPIFNSCKSLVRDVQNVQNEAAASVQTKPWRSSLEEIREFDQPIYGPCKSLVRDMQNVQNEAAASVQTKPWKSSLEEIRESQNPMFNSCKSLVRDVQNVQNVQNEVAASVQTKPWRSSLEAIRELDQPIYGPCKSLVRDVQNVQNEAAASVQTKPWKSSLEEIRESQNPTFDSCKSLVRGEEMTGLVGTKPLVFQSRRFGREADPRDDFPPAIRTPSRSPRRDGQRPMSVHFEDEVKAMLGPKDDDDAGSSSSSSSSSSGSVVSFKGQASRADRRSEAEGKEDDVHSIMRKYLGKE